MPAQQRGRLLRPLRELRLVELHRPDWGGDVAYADVEAGRALCIAPPEEDRRGKGGGQTGAVSGRRGRVPGSLRRWVSCRLMTANPSGIKPDVGESIAKYNAAYASSKDFVPEPNAFLARCLERIAAAPPPPQGAPVGPVARALDIGIGQGRNAFLLVRAGYDTTGIDRSEVGVEAARRGTAALGVKLRAVVADAQTYDFGCECWDLIALLYYPLPIALLDRVKASVRAGGYIVVERFSQKDKDAVGPDAEDGRLPNPMLRHFLDWNVLHYEHDVFQSDWHWSGESPTGPIVRLLARKP